MFSFNSQFNYTSFGIFCQLKYAKRKKGGEEMNNLRYYRQKAELTQTELSNRTGLEQSKLARVEAGGRDFKGQEWKLLAKELGCTIDELLGVVK